MISECLKNRASCILISEPSNSNSYHIITWNYFFEQVKKEMITTEKGNEKWKKSANWYCNIIKNIVFSHFLKEKSIRVTFFIIIKIWSKREMKILGTFGPTQHGKKIYTCGISRSTKICRVCLLGLFGNDLKINI